MQKKSLYWYSTIFLFLAVANYFHCSREVNYLPTTLLSCQLEKKLTGDAAKQWVDKIHRKEITPLESEIGFYQGKNGPITLYVSCYHDEKLAQKEYLRMTEKISPQNSIFIRGEFVELDGKKIYRCFGMGQTHFVFAQNNRLIWLSVNTIGGKDILLSYLELID
jgi:hypothetical protein